MSIPSMQQSALAPQTNLADPETQRRLTPPALRTFFNIAQAWNINAEEGRHLLGGISTSLYYQLRSGDIRSDLNMDTLTRISYILGIYKALHLVFGDDLADRWMSIPNTNPLFAGERPLDFVLRRGIDGMQQTRRLLDGRRGGR